MATPAECNSLAGSPGPRRISKMLVANRGEIAARVINLAREVNLEVYALFTQNDDNHTFNVDPSHVIRLPSPTKYMDIDFLINVVKKYEIDSVHPGYGFLSESAEFADRMWTEAGAIVIGPGKKILERTGDKLQARRLAAECNVPVLPALEAVISDKSTDDVLAARAFADKVGYPLMVKAIDGGGGRGIKIAQNLEQLLDMLAEAIVESPSRKVYVEKAALGGFRHIEVQILGDYSGNIMHLWERECSIQRRFQKIVEFCPSSIQDRKLVSKVINAAIRMAKKVKYVSLGTFEFLVHESRPEYYFMEVNPRIQVEHTITEQMCCGIDLVRTQLQIACGARLDQILAGLPQCSQFTVNTRCIQLRITAEDVQRNWAPSVGKITRYHFPAGQGIRVDTHITQPNAIIGADFDPLLAKVIVTANGPGCWFMAVRKARRVLDDCRIDGIKTNLDILRPILAHADFLDKKCDTQWLENLDLTAFLDTGFAIKNDLALKEKMRERDVRTEAGRQEISLVEEGSGFTLHAGDKLQMVLSRVPPASVPQSSEQLGSILAGIMDESLRFTHARVQQVDTNDTNKLSAAIACTNVDGSEEQFSLKLSKTGVQAADSQSGNKHRQGNPAEHSGHVVSPFPGKIVEILVDEGDVVTKGQTCAVIRQMKMELEIPATKDGVVTWVFEGDEDEDVVLGTLIAEISDPHKAAPSKL